MFSLKELIQITGGKVSGIVLDGRVTGVSIDSRTIKKNELYIAIVGKQHDGHDFVSKAIVAGARVIICSKKMTKRSDVTVILVKDTTKALGQIAAFHRRRFSVPVITITGSVGKTTTKELLARVLGSQYCVLKNEKSFNNQFGVPLTLLKLSDKHQMVVLECGTNQPGDMKWLGEIAKPDTVILLNIGESHLLGLKNCRGVFDEKFHLVKACSPFGTIIYNQDDTYLAKLKDKKLKQKKIAFSVKQEARMQAINISSKKQGGFSFTFNKQTYFFKTSSRDFITSALAVICCGQLYNISYTNINKQLAKTIQSSGRMQVHRLRQGTLIDDTYNANPLSLKCAIKVLDQYHIKGKKILCVADMLELGTRSKQLHLQMGAFCAEHSVDIVLSLGEHAFLMTQNVKILNPSIKVFHYKTHAGLLARLNREWQTDSVVLVKGSRGMRMDRIVDGFKANS